MDWMYLFISGTSSHAFEREYVSHVAVEGPSAVHEVLDPMEDLDSSLVDANADSVETVLGWSSRKTRVGLGARLSQGNICIIFSGSGFVSGTWYHMFFGASG